MRHSTFLPRRHELIVPLIEHIFIRRVARRLILPRIKSNIRPCEPAALRKNWLVLLGLEQYSSERPPRNAITRRIYVSQTIWRAEREKKGRAYFLFAQEVYTLKIASRGRPTVPYVCLALPIKVTFPTGDNPRRGSRVGDRARPVTCLFLGSLIFFGYINLHNNVYPLRQNLSR